jgi:hypothetical protein
VEVKGVQSVSRGSVPPPSRVLELSPHELRLIPVASPKSPILAVSLGAFGAAKLGAERTLAVASAPRSRKKSSTLLRGGGANEPIQYHGWGWRQHIPHNSQCRRSQQQGPQQVSGTRVTASQNDKGHSRQNGIAHSSQRDKRQQGRDEPAARTGS